MPKFPKKSIPSTATLSPIYLCFRYIEFMLNHHLIGLSMQINITQTALANETLIFSDFQKVAFSRFFPPAKTRCRTPRIETKNTNVHNATPHNIYECQRFLNRTTSQNSNTTTHSLSIRLWFLIGWKIRTHGDMKPWGEKVWVFDRIYLLSVKTLGRYIRSMRIKRLVLFLQSVFKMLVMNVWKWEWSVPTAIWRSNWKGYSYYVRLTWFYLDKFFLVLSLKRLCLAPRHHPPNNTCDFEY